MEKSSVFEWCKRFKEDRENVEDEISDHPRCHRMDENVENVRNLCLQIDVYHSCGCAIKFRRGNSESHS
jgi:hypothetical protein